uniref:Ig-like domain-containing protein n=1 Tax=Calidris pygmaea TaxID=425635 RepID=A0A8C3KGL9_9CHAR
MEGHYLPAKNIGSALKITLPSSSFMPLKCRTVASTPLRYPTMWASALVLPKLENITSILKGTAVFQCIVAGAQPLSVSWIKDEKILDDDEHHHITFENSVATLKLINVDLSHRGRYTCQSLTCVTNCHFYTLYTLEPAQIIEKAKSLKVTERDPVTLECTVAGTPELRIRWYKDGKQLLPSRYYTMSFENNVASFRIEPVSKEDSGTYSFKVENDFGSSTCEAVLTVLEPPVFSRKPSPVDMLRGTEVSLECEISGTPPFDVTWYKDRRQIRSSKKYKVTAKNYHTSVRILNVEAADVGEYQCKAQNDVGSDTCFCTMKLKGKVLVHMTSEVLPMSCSLSFLPFLPSFFI